MEVVFKERSSKVKDTFEMTVCSIKPLTTRATYYVFLCKMRNSLTCEVRFQEKNSIQTVYLLPIVTNRDTKLITFQYKVIHNILPN